MVVFSLTLLLCSLTTRNLVKSVAVLDNSSDPWKNWLLNEDSSPLSKRITAKSVFIAPIFDKCPQGQRLDHMGKCVKVVHLDEVSNQALHWSILETKLKLLFPASSPRPREDTESQTRTTIVNSGTSNNHISSSRSSTTTTTTNSTSEPIATTIATITEPLLLNSVTMMASDRFGQVDNTSVPVDVSLGPFQLSIPFHSKNSSEYMDDSRPILGAPFMTTTIGYGFGKMTTDAYSTAQTTLPLADSTFSANYLEGYADDATENAETMTTTMVYSEFATPFTVSNYASSPPSPLHAALPSFSRLWRGKLNEMSSSPLLSTWTFSEPEAIPNWLHGGLNSSGFQSEATFHAAPIAFTINRYQQVAGGDTSQMAIKFPESIRQNESSVNWFASRYLGQENTVRGSQTVTNISSKNSDISDSNLSSSGSSNSDTSSGSSSSSSSSSSSGGSNSNVITLDSFKSDLLYQKLPSNGRTRPKCDLGTGYDCGFGGATKPNTVPTAAFDKLSYMTQYGNRDRSSQPLRTFIRFPSSLTQEESSAVRFQPRKKQFLVGGDAGNVKSVMFPLEDTTSSRYWESSRYSVPTYWGQSLTMPSKAQFVKIWSSSVPAANNFKDGDINYSLRSQRKARKLDLKVNGGEKG